MNSPLHSLPSLEEEIHAVTTEQTRARAAFWRSTCIRLVLVAGAMAAGIALTPWTVRLACALVILLCALSQMIAYRQWRDDSRGREVRLEELRGRWRLRHGIRTI